MNQEHATFYKKAGGEGGVKGHFSTPITPGFRKAEENQVDPVSCQNICS